MTSEQLYDLGYAIPVFSISKSNECMYKKKYYKIKPNAEFHDVDIGEQTLKLVKLQDVDLGT